MNFLTKVVAGLVLSAGTAFAAPTFVAPVKEQTGTYTVTEVNGGESWSNTNASIEVFEGGDTIFGYTVPQGKYLILGDIRSPGSSVIFQSEVPATFNPVLQSFPVTVGESRFDAAGITYNVVLGSGLLTFDPDYEGKGKVLNLESAFNQPVFLYGTDRRYINLRLDRLKSNVRIFACAGNTGNGFGPFPPTNLCN